MRPGGTIVARVFEHSLNGDIFREYVRQFPVPSLRPGDIVIMDNLFAHKAGSIAGAVESAGACVKFPPPYNPDFNPIELMRSKMKAILRKLKIRAAE